jgi:SAM domain (Sterile alpha motif)
MRPRATRRRRAQEAAGDCGEGDDWLAIDGDGLADAEKGATGDVVSVQDVREWLRRVGFSEYEPAFVANDINGAVLKTLTSEELRDDLQVTNLRHRRDLGLAIQRLIAATTPATVDALPEHGRILDHLSNVRGGRRSAGGSG